MLPFQQPFKPRLTITDLLPELFELVQTLVTKLGKKYKTTLTGFAPILRLT